MVGVCLLLAVRSLAHKGATWLNSSHCLAGRVVRQVEVRQLFGRVLAPTKRGLIISEIGASLLSIIKSGSHFLFEFGSLVLKNF